MVINQPFGIGDILFLEPLYRFYWNRNKEKPIVPVRDHLIWIKDYISSAEFVPMSQFRIDYESTRMHDPNYFPARFANQIYRKLSPHDHRDIENMMLDKYWLAYQHALPKKGCGDLHQPEFWKTLQINFSEEKGKQLAHHLNLNYLRDEYVLVNEHSGVGKIDINPSTGKRIIKMHEVPGFTVLDWWLIMACANENHHVSTSTFYIFQAIYNKHNWFKHRSKIFLYPRPNIDGLRGISKLDPDFTYTIGSI